MTQPDETLIERMARALYEDWVNEDFANEYAGWELLGDKSTWLSRAQAALASSDRADLVRRVEELRSALFNMRSMLIAVHDGLEDEGDRVYLGSSNHAELIHKAWHEADSAHWDAMLEGDAATLNKEQS